ncbi:MAG: hypothetical protein F2817_20375, partial [Actinobacteria bacterium]|nr:hypothetical protein [Actinomycetota bacterium]
MHRLHAAADQGRGLRQRCGGQGAGPADGADAAAPRRPAVAGPRGRRPRGGHLPRQPRAAPRGGGPVIALLRGAVHERRADSVVLLTAGGVGYVLNCSNTTLAALPPAGDEVTLLCHLAVREDAMTLFGFGSEPERDLFHLLLTVQAVGPKLALAVLSAGGPDEVATSIAGGDAKRLQQV